MVDTVTQSAAPSGEAMMEALRDIELRCHEHAAGTLEKDESPEIWAGTLYYVGETALLSPLTDVVEVLDPPQDITRVPAAKSWVRGVANNRGTLLPIFDLQAFLFGTHTAQSLKNRVLVVRQDEFTFGLLVGDVVGIRHFQASAHRQDAPGRDERLGDLIAGSYSMGQEQVPVFSLRLLGLDARFISAAA